MLTPARAQPAHGGYPTPSYDEADERRRRESQRLFGHPGASVFGTVRDVLEDEATKRKAGLRVFDHGR